MRAFASTQSQSSQHAACRELGGARTVLLADANDDTGMASESGMAASSPDRHTTSGPKRRCTHGYLQRRPFKYIYIHMWIYMKQALARLLGSHAVQGLATAKIIMDLAASSLDRRAQTALCSTAHIRPCTVADGQVQFQSDPDGPNPPKNPCKVVRSRLVEAHATWKPMPPHPYENET